MSAPQTTPEQLHAAFAWLRRSDWPATLEEALAHPLRGRLVRLVARLQAEGVRVVEPAAVPRPAVIRPEPPLQRRRKTRAASAPPQQLDRKRAAAGEREDD